MQGFSHIEKLVEDFENYLQNCKEKLFSSNEIIVSRDEVEFYISAIKKAIEPEKHRFAGLLKNKNEIIKDAEDKADKILSDANAQVTEITNELQIMQTAYARANKILETARKEEEEILETARKKATDMQMNAMYYTDGILRDVQVLIKETVSTNTQNLEAANRSLKSIFDTITENRNELPILDDNAQEQQEEQQQPQQRQIRAYQAQGYSVPPQQMPEYASQVKQPGYAEQIQQSAYEEKIQQAAYEEQMQQLQDRTAQVQQAQGQYSPKTKMEGYQTGQIPRTEIKKQPEKMKLDEPLAKEIDPNTSKMKSVKVKLKSDSAEDIIGLAKGVLSD